MIDPPRENTLDKLTAWSKKRKIDDVNDDAASSSDDLNWENLFKELKEQRFTKAEELLQAHITESEEREKLMRSYNQELEVENQTLRSKLAAQPEQTQQIQELKSQLMDMQAKLSEQAATVQAYQRLTGTSLEVNTSDMDGESQTLDCICTVENSATNAQTKFRISTVPNNNSSSTTGGGLLKYQPLQNSDLLEEFLQDEIEFESSELPPLLQNVLRGIFPDD